MPHRRTLPNRLIEFCLLAVCLSLTVTSTAAEAGWKAGTATVMITPDKPMWMAGYGHRDKLAEGALHPLWLKVLALEDAMAYIPSARVLKEDLPALASGRWGYEGNTSMYVYGLPAHRWADDVEELIATGVQRLVHRVNAPEQQGRE